MKARAVFGAFLLTFAAALPSAYAGPYLDRAAILLSDARRGSEWLLTHLSDKELATILREMAEARLRAARKLTVPKEVIGAHPHLLLTLENAERAAAAAQEGSNERFLHYLRLAREEDANFRAVLAAQKYELPPIDGKK